MKLVGFGDSLTYGYLVNKGYLDFLKEFMPNLEIVNSGIPGDTAVDGLKRIEYSVLRHNPDITIVEFCVNDAFSGISVSKFEKYFSSILEKIPNKKLIMIPHMLFDDFDCKIVKPFYERLKEIANINSFPVIDVSKHKLTKNELLLDNLHPNENGYKVYAEEAFKMLLKIVGRN